MIRRRVVCPCSRESDVLAEHELRSRGWRLVPASGPLGDVFAWVCPEHAAQRNALLEARSAS